MSEPSREHVEAVAGLLHAERCCVDALPGHGDATADAFRSDARALLTSTDPAVLDAMQDALVRAGRLTEERWDATGSPRRALSDFNPTRLVTEWRESS